MDTPEKRGPDFYLPEKPDGPLPAPADAKAPEPAPQEPPRTEPSPEAKQPPSPRGGGLLPYLTSLLAVGFAVLLALSLLTLRDCRQSLAELPDAVLLQAELEKTAEERDAAQAQAKRQIEVMESYREKAERLEEDLEVANSDFLSESRLGAALWHVLLAKEYFDRGDYESSAEVLRQTARYFPRVGNITSLGMDLPTDEYYSFQVITMELAGKLRGRGYLSQLESDKLAAVFEVLYGDVPIVDIPVGDAD